MIIIAEPVKKDDTIYCKRCGRILKPVNFYSSNNLEKYPNGKVDLCKKCMTAKVNCWDSDTYLWILKECDIPYLPSEWNKVLAEYASGKDPTDIKTTTIIGRYISKMKLTQYKKARYADSEQLQQLQNNLVAEKMRAQGFSEGDIAEQIAKGSVAVPENPTVNKAVPDVEAASELTAADMVTQMPSGSNYFDQKNKIDLADNEEVELTNLEKLQLRTKWGKNYSVEEWLWLEKLYTEMTESFDIQTAAHVDNLKMLCKTSLKANQLLDVGDIESANKMLKTYDTLMKQGKFSAAQNKAESNDFVDSVGEMVLMCEKDGFIPRFYTDGPQDKVDRVLQDNQLYLRQLVTEELNLGSLIEKAIKEIQEDKEKEEQIGNITEDADAEKAYEDSLFETNSDGTFADLIAATPLDLAQYDYDVPDDYDAEESGEGDAEE